MPSSDEDSLLTRWEPPSFDPPKPPKPPKVAPILYPTVEEVEAIRDSAYKEAYESIFKKYPPPNRRPENIKQSLEVLVSILDYLGFQYVGPEEAEIR